MSELRVGTWNVEYARGVAKNRARLALLVHGDEDHHVPIDFMFAPTGRYPSWDVSVLAGGGHHLHVDQPDAWLEITTPWLRELD